MTELAIITVLYNSDEVLEKFIKSFSIQTYKNFTLYLIDNSASDSTDTLIGTLAKKYPVNKIIHIKNAVNNGAAGGNNVGIKEALKNGSDLILLTNTDVKFNDIDLLKKAMDFFISSKEKIIVPKIFTAGKEKVWSAGGGFNSLLAKAQHYGYEKEDTAGYTISKHVKYAPTTFMFIQKEVFENVGLLDEKYFAYFEDSDFIFRSNKKGYKIFYWPAIDVEHLVSYTTGGKASLFVLYYGARNRIYFTKKNLPFYKWFITFPYILLLSFCRLIKYNPAQRKATIKGVIDGFKLS